MHISTLKTVALLAGLGGLLVVAGRVFLGSSGAVLGLGLGLAFVGGSYWFSDKLAIRAARAEPADEAELPEYFAIVRQLADKSGLPMPRLYVSPAEQPNAFATGRNPGNAAVAVTRGILHVLSWDELRGVLAHELGHVRNRDILIGSVAAAVAVGITYVAQIGRFASFFGGRRDGESTNPVAFLLLLVLAPVAATLMQLALSRNREYEADRAGAELLEDGEALARALEKIEHGTREMPMNVDPAHAQAFIVNPLSGRSLNFANLFRSHPPTADRAARLRSENWVTS